MQDHEPKQVTITFSKNIKGYINKYIVVVQIVCIGKLSKIDT